MLHTVQDVDVDLSQAARLGNEILAKISSLNFGHSLGFRGVDTLNIRLHRR